MYSDRVSPTLEVKKKKGGHEAKEGASTPLSQWLRVRLLRDFSSVSVRRSPAWQNPRRGADQQQRGSKYSVIPAMPLFAFLCASLHLDRQTV